MLWENGGKLWWSFIQTGKWNADQEIKFLKDPSFQDLTAAIEKSDAESAFRAAHTLKGICLNLGFDNLYKPSEALTEKLRGGELNGYETLYDEVKEQYDKPVEAINEIAE